ncbi:hypothetical protein Pd630_LPD07939 [Rhodococcus opacus PD630]|nr:hypothetical protein Pd630_LPD07939 [Rhodococcus opacus PD630]
MSVRLVAGAPVALVDHARAECPGLDQVERDVFGDRRQERRAATDDDRIAEYAQLVDEAELDNSTLIPTPVYPPPSRRTGRSLRQIERAFRSSGRSAGGAGCPGKF